MSIKQIAYTFLHWLGAFTLYLSATLLLGGLIGALLFLIVGAITHGDIPVVQRLSHGFVDGFLYAGIWAIGLAIVLCVMRGHREHTANKQNKEA